MQKINNFGNYTSPYTPLNHATLCNLAKNPIS
jgi:hypothetical protein